MTKNNDKALFFIALDYFDFDRFPLKGKDLYLSVFD